MLCQAYLFTVLSAVKLREWSRDSQIGKQQKSFMKCTKNFDMIVDWRLDSLYKNFIILDALLFLLFRKPWMPHIVCKVETETIHRPAQMSCLIATGNMEMICLPTLIPVMRRYKQNNVLCSDDTQHRDCFSVINVHMSENDN